MHLAAHKKGVHGAVKLPDDEYRRLWLDRVKARVLVTSAGCWEWQGAAHRGYGITTFRKGTRSRVHRLMYMAVNQLSLRPDQYVCHSCDNRLCCNPDHLWLGTAADNARDMTQKGRHWLSGKALCDRGHEFAIRGDRKICLACNRIRTRIKVLGWAEEEAVGTPALPSSAETPRRSHERMKVCAKGHPLNSETAYTTGRGHLVCKVCTRANGIASRKSGRAGEYQRRYRAKKKLQETRT